MRFFTLCILLFLVLVIFPAAEARIRRYKWEVKYEYKSPDCFQKMVITINGQSPGPTILAEEGDTVIIELTNGLVTENVAIHWHGIRQIGTPWFDGTEGVAQCPILPGETFTYEYKVDRPGTYLYHAHYGMQREAGLYGSIRVSVPRGKTEPFSYEYDRSIILNGVSAATLPCNILSLLSLIIPALIALVGLQSKNDTLTVFEAHPTTIKVTVASLLAFVVACGIDLGFHTYHSPSWAALLRTIIVFSALLSVASLSSLLFPEALVSAGRECERVGQRFMEKLHNLFTRIPQYQMRRNPPVIPLTNMGAGAVYTVPTSTSTQS